MPNSLLGEFKTPYQTAPFDQIKNSDFLPAFNSELAVSEKEIIEIANNPQEPSFANTIEALSYSNEKLEVISSILFNLNSANTTEELQKIAQTVSPLLTEFASKIAHNQALFTRIKKVYEAKNQLDLDPEQTTLLEKTYKDFVRGGALLSEKDKKNLEEINKDLAVKALKFGENVLASTNAYSKTLKDASELEGIPESTLEQYALEAKQRGEEGYTITLQYPSYLPALTYLKNRDLRKELYLANAAKSFDKGPNDNQTLIKELSELREKKAALLDYASYAHYVLEERMAKTPEAVSEFLNELLLKATPYAEQEIKILKGYAHGDGIEVMEAWDHAYYAEKRREKELELNQEELRAYFPLAKALDSVFDLAFKLFGLQFERQNEISVYHSDVQVYDVTENGVHKAILYTDFHPRKEKRSGAWMTSFKTQLKKSGQNQRPHVSVVCNFSKPTSTTPSLLTFQELTTLFHEFGHAIHGMLADTTYPTLSGTSVKWDFVELPSQFLENYCYEPEFLQSFAHHYLTNEPLSLEKIEKLSKSKSFMEGYQTLRQVGFGLLDQAYHSITSPIEDVKAFETKATLGTSLYPSHVTAAISPSFSHIFQGGYASGYYSYKWAEVLDADAFAFFKEKGLFDAQTASKYKILLAAGGSVDPMDLYKAFRGREPQVESLFKRAFGSL